MGSWEVRQLSSETLPNSDCLNLHTPAFAVSASVSELRPSRVICFQEVQERYTNIWNTVDSLAKIENLNKN